MPLNITTSKNIWLYVMRSGGESERPERSQTSSFQKESCCLVASRAQPFLSVCAESPGAAGASGHNAL